MKALVKYEKGRSGMGIREMPVPDPAEGEVRIRIKAAGICGSDIHSMLDERETVMPVILGHEFVGVIDKTNGDCGDLKSGDWVTGLPAAYSCGKCRYCKAGEVSICEKRGSVGTHYNGAMAEYMVMPAKFCYKVPDNYENKLAFAAAEPLACTVRGVYDRLDVKKGDVAVVSGPGIIGLFTLQTLKSRGAVVIVSGLPSDRKRLEKAMELGADEIAENFDELSSKVKKYNPDGADIVCETSGAGPSLNACLNIAKIHGQVLQVGVMGKPVSVLSDLILIKELTLIGTNSSAVSSWDITMRLIAEGNIDPMPLISLQLPLDKWEEGFQATIDKTGYKVILIP